MDQGIDDKPIRKAYEAGYFRLDPYKGDHSKAATTRDTPIDFKVAIEGFRPEELTRRERQILDFSANREPVWGIHWTVLHPQPRSDSRPN
ncbi:hypothetical protein [Parasedimentitalea psychrophila]|uniref:Uncharacterized protein n=1 Tax=Parasedimentitalea psychrophila TaxID=2997337 RepID=A0A9Y2L2E3_9RHOB|nr:hypothetical protein [Parasedimentitalea psychrophila]WIY26888.1 hypothetical protein QPJ95_08245 [Parasedimentitalea psychrophila]